VLHGVDLDIAAGQVVALLGPNGEGKSTLLRVLAGLLPCESGTVRLVDRELERFTARERARRLALVFQGARPVFPFTVEEYVAQGRFPHVGPWHRPGEGDAGAVQSALARTGLVGLAHRNIETLSGGEWQRAGVARGLAQGADVLLLDEPKGHLDLRHRTILGRVLREEARAGRGVLWVLHDIELALDTADRALLLAGGRVIADGTPRDVLTPERLRMVYELDEEGGDG